MAANSTEIAKATAACELLSTPFLGRVTTPETSVEYEAEARHPWSQTCWIFAAGFVQLNNAQEVAQALAIVQKTGSKFVIRTSGHNPNVDFSSVDKTGVVLDLRALNSKVLENDVMQAGAGNNWGEVYTYLEKNELSAIGGREQGVGLAGFLLGGMICNLPTRD
jgi:FAD/FMN-containing dehydrogenase